MSSEGIAACLDTLGEEGRSAGCNAFRTLIAGCKADYSRGGVCEDGHMNGETAACLLERVAPEQLSEACQAALPAKEEVRPGGAAASRGCERAGRADLIPPRHSLESPPNPGAPPRLPFFAHPTACILCCAVQAEGLIYVAKTSFHFATRPSGHPFFTPQSHALAMRTGRGRIKYSRRRNHICLVFGSLFPTLNFTSRGRTRSHWRHEGFSSLYLSAYLLRRPRPFLSSTGKDSRRRSNPKCKLHSDFVCCAISHCAHVIILKLHQRVNPLRPLLEGRTRELRRMHTYIRCQCICHNTHIT